MLQVDLVAAKIEYEVTGSDGVKRYADFHALRHTFVTFLSRSGLTVKQAQALARHSTPTLTFGTYCHVTEAELGEAVAKLPAIGAGPAKESPLATLPRHDLECWAMVGLLLSGAVAGRSLVVRRVVPNSPERLGTAVNLVDENQGRPNA